MGRIELLSPAQRAAITRIAAGPVSDLGWWQRYSDEKLFTMVGEQMVWRPGGQALHQRIFGPSVRGLFKEIGVPMPDDYRAYLALGRFRDALLLDEQRRRPDPELAKFIATYQIEGNELSLRRQRLENEELAREQEPAQR
jgi:hypothetical protein